MDSIFNKPNIKSKCASCDLQNLFVFRHLNVEQLSCFSYQMDQLNYEPGEFIFKQGASPNGFICLKKGKVKITQLANNGKELIIDLKSPPDTLGIRALSTNSRYQSSAVALDHVSICLIPSKDFYRILDSCPSVYKELFSYIGERLVRADQKLVSLTQKTLRARLADTLLLLQENIGEDFEGGIDIPLKRSEIAQLSNMTTSNVIRTLSEFKRDKLIDLKDRKIKIIDKKNLFNISNFDKF